MLFKDLALPQNTIQETLWEPARFASVEELVTLSDDVKNPSFYNEILLAVKRKYKDLFRKDQTSIAK